MSLEVHQDTVNRYRRFEVDEARGIAETYENLAHLVSEYPMIVLSLIAHSIISLANSIGD